MKHIGEYIREKVIPSDMTVKAAAELLGVGRPTLSNLLNGKASLSKGMAQKLEKAFDASAEDLLLRQSASQSDDSSSTETTKVHVPPFLDMKAAQIEEWIENQKIDARSRLAVFLRSLVNATNSTVSECDFPGNDHSQRPGWDGYVVATAGNPWVPTGISGWEFGVDKKVRVKAKADSDYKKSLKLPAEERQKTTFIFVTPRTWSGKKAWVRNRKEEKQWKDVRVYDQSDLEQWLEQSIPTQAWLANELKIQSQGTHSLDQHWTNWSADCDPPLKPTLFSEAMEDVASDQIASRLQNREQILIKSGSKDEGVAFLCALFGDINPELSKYRDRIVYFTEEGVMPKLLSGNTTIIPVVATAALEKELASFKSNVASITIQPANISGMDAGYAVETLSAAGFSAALKDMGVASDESDRLARESGRSLTVLRRALSKTEAIRAPEWARDSSIASSLVPIALAGAWNIQEDADKDVVSILANDRDYEEIEQDLLRLHQLEDSPVWMIDSYRGVVSKYDSLFSIRNSISEASIVRFLDFAEVVLSADDPTLDLPEDQRWLSTLHGKKREFSAALRRSISETLVLLSINEVSLFRNRLGLSIADRVNRLIRNVLSPLSTRLLEAQASDLPLYAEAAPDEFLKIIEKNLAAEKPVVFDIIGYKTSSMFSSPPYVSLLWALEIIAWAPERFERCCWILAQLHENASSENTSHSPANTLTSLFRSWHPQTAATLIQRQTVLKNLAKKYPDSAWLICLKQLGGGTDISIPTHKPHWRTDARGTSKGVSRKDKNDFENFAFKQAVARARHSTAELQDLVLCMSNLAITLQAEIWPLIELWRKNASDSDMADLRETIRINFFTTFAQKKLGHTFSRKECKSILKNAEITYDLIEPTDSTHRHRWLFTNNDSVLNWDDLTDDMDWRTRARKVAELRESVIFEILEAEGLRGVVSLANGVDCPEIVGQHTTAMIKDRRELADAIKRVFVEYNEMRSDHSRKLLIGILWEAQNKRWIVNIFDMLKDYFNESDLLELYLLAPHSAETWSMVNGLQPLMHGRYWREVNFRFPLNANEVPLAFSNLLKADRPLAALSVLDYEMSAVSPRLLYEALDKATTSVEKGHESFFSYFEIEKAFQVLGVSGNFTVAELSVLEYRYLAALDKLHPEIPNIEKLINDSPEYYVQQIVYTSGRKDGREDPVEFGLSDDESRMKLARQSSLLLDALRKIPGRDASDAIESNALITWIQYVQKALSRLARSDYGGYMIGQLLSRCGADEDGCWPCEPVRNALEATFTDEMAHGFEIGKMNLRGVHFRGKGGTQERALASDFNEWAKRINGSHPKLAKVLRDIRNHYLRDGEREDRNADVYNRLV